MSSEIFSQSDLSALLGGAARAAAAAAAPSAGEREERGTRPLPDVHLYDFRRPHRVSKDRLRALEAMYERLGKSLEGWLIGRVRSQVEVTLQSVEQFSFGEFTLSLPSPCAAFIFDVSDTGGQHGVIEIGLDFGFYVVERFFGGNSEPAQMERGLSNIEIRAVRLVADRIRVLLMETWHDHVPMELAFSGFESLPEILQSSNREDPVLVANFAAKVGTVTGRVRVCLPFSPLEKFFSGQGSRRVKNPGGSPREIEAARRLTETLLMETPLPLSARLPEFRLSMGELSALEVGSVISTGVPCDAEVEVWVGGERRLRALPGRAAKTLALRIVQSLPVPATEPEPVPAEEREN